MFLDFDLVFVYALKQCKKFASKTNERRGDPRSHQESRDLTGASAPWGLLRDRPGDGPACPSKAIEPKQMQYPGFGKHCGTRFDGDAKRAHEILYIYICIYIYMATSH